MTKGICRNVRSEIFNARKAFVASVDDMTKRFCSYLAFRIQNRIVGVLESYTSVLHGFPRDFTRCVDKNIVDAFKAFIIDETFIVKEKAINNIAKSNSDGRVCLGTSASPSSSNEYVSKLKRMSRKGLLKVLLTAYVKLLPNFVSKGEETRSWKDSVGIFNFVNSLATLDKWTVDHIYFRGDLTRFLVIPVAAKYPTSIGFYARRIEKYSHQKDIDAIFVVAMGPLNSLVAEEAARIFHQKNQEEFNIRFKDNYKVLCGQTYAGDGHEAKGITVFLPRRKLVSNERVHPISE